MKNRLSHYVRRVQAGEAVVVTDRGRAVAELGPLGRVSPGARVDPEVARLINRGLLALGTSNAARAYPRLPRLLRSHTAAGLLDAERGRR